MDILAMRKSTGQLSGCVLLDGQPATPAFISHTAYIPQASAGCLLVFRLSVHHVLPASACRDHDKQMCCAVEVKFADKCC
jgi:hypothetical protein